MEVIKIGVIGPKPCFVGGHDINDDIRLQIKKWIIQQLKKHKDNTVVGLSGLSLGVEQDFVQACIGCNIDFSGYLSHENQQDQWVDMPVVEQGYKDLLDKSLGYIIISNGQFSPRKHIKKLEKICKDSDIILYINNIAEEFDLLIEELLEKFKNKEIIRYHSRVEQSGSSLAS